VATGGTFTKTGGTITGYASDQSRNGNAIFDSEGKPIKDSGYAVYAEYGIRRGLFVSNGGHKRKETTAGPDVDLYVGDGTFSGSWDY
jgi:hypothetical protein